MREILSPEECCSPAATELQAHSPVRNCSESPKFQSAMRASPQFEAVLTPVRMSVERQQQMAHDLAATSLFQAQLYTKKNPKVHCDNPITGLRTDSVSPMRKRAMAGYGTLLVNQ